MLYKPLISLVMAFAAASSVAAAVTPNDKGDGRTNANPDTKVSSNPSNKCSTSSDAATQSLHQLTAMSWTSITLITAPRQVPSLLYLSSGRRYPLWVCGDPQELKNIVTQSGSG
ncbi:hypothetical protein BC826DRAFT_1190717 [Russula brevipes]|nr:hypothetical protein BC826DRAFT_1190717 [Russula brevipes]